MNIGRNRISLAEDTYAYIGRLSHEQNAERFKTEIQKYISILNELIESDFNKLNDKQLYDLLSKIYYISLDENDYLEMLSKKNNREYTHIYDMPTTMTFISTATEGHGNGFDWWEQLYQVYYHVTTSNEFKFDYNKTYSKEEIRRLLSDKSIVILKSEHIAIDDAQDFVQENYEKIPTLGMDIKNYSNNISQFVLDNYGLFGQLLRKRFTKSKVLIDAGKIINALNMEMKDIFSSERLKDPYYSGTTSICKELFESSEEKKEYQAIQKTLKPKKGITIK